MKLFFHSGELTGREFPLNPPGVSLGRETDNDIILTGAAISRYHLKIEWEDGKWFLRDLNSANGTKLNGARIAARTAIKVGDQIQAGLNQALVSETQSTASAPPPLAATAIVAPPPAPAPAPAAEKAAAAGPEAAPGSAPAAAAPAPAQPAEPPPRKAASEHKSAGFNAFFDAFKSKPAAPAVSETNLFGPQPRPMDEAPETGTLHSKRAGRLFFAAVISLGFFLVAWYVIISESLEAKRADSGKSATAPATLMAIYEKQIVAPDNVFRYALTLKPEFRDAPAVKSGEPVPPPERFLKAEVTVDDLKNGIHFSREKTLDAEVASELAADLRRTDFMSLTGPRRGEPGEDNIDRVYSLTLSDGPAFNRVEVANNYLPQSFQNVIDILEAFSQNHLNVFAIELTPEERLEKARELFETADRLYRNRDAAAKNLAQSIARYNAVAELLQAFDPKPKMYYAAMETMKTAEAQLDKAIDDLLFNVRKSIHVNDLQSARADLYKITGMLDRQDDKRYQTARKMLLELERNLKKEKR